MAIKREDGSTEKQGYQDIFAEITESVIAGLEIDMMKDIVGFNYDLIKKHIKQLLLNGALTQLDDKTIEITDKGIEFLRNYRGLRNLYGPEYLISSGPLEKLGGSEINIEPIDDNQIYEKKRQTNLDKIAEILNKATNGAKKTQIMYGAGLCSAQLRYYFNELLSQGFLEMNAKQDYKTTEKGLKFLGFYKGMENSLKPENSSIYPYTVQIETNGNRAYAVVKNHN